MHNGVLLLTLRVFSATGGIEKVCKVVCKALEELKDELFGGKLKVLSMYDAANDAEEKYLPAQFFSGYGQQKLPFIKDAVKLGTRSRVVILSHINLLSIGFLIKLFSPRTKLVLFAHGIEVWGPLSVVRKRMLARCDLVLSVSQFTKDRMMEAYGLQAEKIKVFNNCLDPFLPAPITTGRDAALKARYGIKEDDLVLMTLTRLSSKELYKGYDHVLRAVSELKQTYPNIKYMVVGKYDEEEKRRLDAIVTGYSLQSYVIFTGYIQDEEMARHYSLADLYVMPSKKEGFGIVFIEAMYYGLPVIAGNKDGSADALNGGKLGILVDPDQQQEIVGAIRKIIENRSPYKPDGRMLEDLFGFGVYKNNISKILVQLCGQ